MVRELEVACAHWRQELGSCLCCLMLNWRSILHLHDINVLQNGSEKCRGNAGTIKAKSFNISHVEIWFKSNEWGNILILDIRKMDVYAIF